MRAVGIRAAALLFALASLPSVRAAGPGFADESLNYAINWPSGLSLGEVHWKATNNGTASNPNWHFSVDLEAHVPGYTLADSYQSKSNGQSFCGLELTRDIHHGAKASSDSITVDANARTATRKTLNGGGESTFTVPSCVRDALAFLFFARHELASGRVPPAQTVIFGGPYEVQLTHVGSGPVKAGDRSYDADHVSCSIRSSASSLSADIYFARDAVRTPVLIKVPVAVGSLTVELVH